jgi:hypothetical protein
VTYINVVVDYFGFTPLKIACNLHFILISYTYFVQGAVVTSSFLVRIGPLHRGLFICSAESLRRLIERLSWSVAASQMAWYPNVSYLSVNSSNAMLARRYLVCISTVPNYLFFNDCPFELPPPMQCMLAASTSMYFNYTLNYLFYNHLPVKLPLYHFTRGSLSV